VGYTVNRTKLPSYILRYSISLDRRRFGKKWDNLRGSLFHWI